MAEDARRASAPSPRRELLVLLVAALALFTANIAALSLPSLDDCFYAREGVEMARRGAFFTVRWNGGLNFDYPSLQIWILSRSFALLGVSDLAARLPSVLMALANLLMTWRIGRRAVGPAAAVAGAALLAIAPYFVNGARRCMMDVPLAFWITLAMLVLIEGRRRPWAHALLALPLGAAVLTKSVLGLLPLAVLAAAVALSRSWRAALRRPWIWLGLVAGLAIGASWSAWEWRRFGPGVLRRHYFGQIGGFAGRRLGWLARFGGYPLLALRDFEPMFLPALPGIVRAARRELREHDPDRLLLLLWAVLPFVLYPLSGTQTSRYLFPIFPPLALLGGAWLDEALPRFARFFRARLAPALAIAAALLFWFAPRTLTIQSNQLFKDEQRRIRALVAPGEPIAFLGTRYWSYANPLMFYAERLLETPSSSAAEAVARARAHPARVLLCGAGRLAEVRAESPTVEILFRSGDWAMVRVPAHDQAGSIDGG